jgi:hypothetical protein
MKKPTAYQKLKDSHRHWLTLLQFMADDHALVDSFHYLDPTDDKMKRIRLVKSPAGTLLETMEP